MKDIERKRLKDLVAKLDSFRGKHTELVSVYIPAGYSMAQTVAQLRNEQSTSMNIKSKTVRKNVTGALERILQHLKLYRETPPNGLAVFCGNISEKVGDADLELFAVEPPEKINVKLYYCDQRFVVDPLKSLIREKEIYGLIVLEKSEAAIGLIRGKSVEMLKHMDSIVPGKTKKGGQSSSRFARVRDGLLFDFLKQVGDVANHQFQHLEDLKGIIIGGPGPLKERMANEDFLLTEVKSKVLGVVDTSYSGEYGLKEVMERSEDILAQASIMKEKKLLDRFFDEMGKDTGLAVYGIRETLQALEGGNVGTLLISEEFDWMKATQKCACGYTKEKIARHGQREKCPKCDADLQTEEKDMLEDLEKLAEQTSASVEMVSTGTPRGVQLKELGGIGGILRFRVE